MQGLRDSTSHINVSEEEQRILLFIATLYIPAEATSVGAALQQRAVQLKKLFAKLRELKQQVATSQDNNQTIGEALDIAASQLESPSESLLKNLKAFIIEHAGGIDSPFIATFENLLKLFMQADKRITAFQVMFDPDKSSDRAANFYKLCIESIDPSRTIANVIPRIRVLHEILQQLIEHRHLTINAAFQKLGQPDDFKRALYRYIKNQYPNVAFSVVLTELRNISNGIAQQVDNFDFQLSSNLVSFGAGLSALQAKIKQAIGKSFSIDDMLTKLLEIIEKLNSQTSCVNQRSVTGAFEVLAPGINSTEQVLSRLSDTVGRLLSDKGVRVSPADFFATVCENSLYVAFLREFAASHYFTTSRLDVYKKLEALHTRYSQHYARACHEQPYQYTPMMPNTNDAGAMLPAVRAVMNSERSITASDVIQVCAKDGSLLKASKKGQELEWTLLPSGDRQLVLPEQKYYLLSRDGKHMRDVSYEEAWKMTASLFYRELYSGRDVEFARVVGPVAHTSKDTVATQDFWDVPVERTFHLEMATSRLLLKKQKKKPGFTFLVVQHSAFGQAVVLPDPKVNKNTKLHLVDEKTNRKFELTCEQAVAWLKSTGTRVFDNEKALRSAAQVELKALTYECLDFFQRTQVNVVNATKMYLRHSATKALQVTQKADYRGRLQVCVPKDQSYELTLNVGEGVEIAVSPADARKYVGSHLKQHLGHEVATSVPKEKPCATFSLPQENVLRYSRAVQLRLEAASQTMPGLIDLGLRKGDALQAVDLVAAQAMALNLLKAVPCQPNLLVAPVSQTCFMLYYFEKGDNLSETKTGSFFLEYDPIYDTMYLFVYDKKGVKQYLHSESWLQDDEASNKPQNMRLHEKLVTFICYGHEYHRALQEQRVKLAQARAILKTKSVLHADVVHDVTTMFATLETDRKFAVTKPAKDVQYTILPTARQALAGLQQQQGTLYADFCAANPGARDFVTMPWGQLGPQNTFVLLTSLDNQELSQLIYAEVQRVAQHVFALRKMLVNTDLLKLCRLLDDKGLEQLAPLLHHHLPEGATNAADIQEKLADVVANISAEKKLEFNVAVASDSVDKEKYATRKVDCVEERTALINALREALASFAEEPAAAAQQDQNFLFLCAIGLDAKSFADALEAFDKLGSLSNVGNVDIQGLLSLKAAYLAADERNNIAKTAIRVHRQAAEQALAVAKQQYEQAVNQVRAQTLSACGHQVAVPSDTDLLALVKGNGFTNDTIFGLHGIGMGTSCLSSVWENFQVSYRTRFIENYLALIALEQQLCIEPENTELRKNYDDAKQVLDERVLIKIREVVRDGAQPRNHPSLSAREQTYNLYIQAMLQLDNTINSVRDVATRIERDLFVDVQRFESAYDELKNSLEDQAKCEHLIKMIQNINIDIKRKIAVLLGSAQEYLLALETTMQSFPGADMLLRKISEIKIMLESIKDAMNGIHAMVNDKRFVGFVGEGRNKQFVGVDRLNKSLAAVRKVRTRIAELTSKKYIKEALRPYRCIEPATAGDHQAILVNLRAGKSGEAAGQSKAAFAGGGVMGQYQDVNAAGASVSASMRGVCRQKEYVDTDACQAVDGAFRGAGIYADTMGVGHTGVDASYADAMGVGVQGYGEADAGYADAMGVGVQGYAEGYTDATMVGVGSVVSDTTAILGKEPQTVSYTTVVASSPESPRSAKSAPRRVAHDGTDSVSSMSPRSETGSPVGGSGGYGLTSSGSPGGSGIGSEGSPIGISGQPAPPATPTGGSGIFGFVPAPTRLSVSPPRERGVPSSAKDAGQKAAVNAMVAGVGQWTPVQVYTAERAAQIGELSRKQSKRGGACVGQQRIKTRKRADGGDHLTYAPPQLVRRSTA